MNRLAVQCSLVALFLCGAGMPCATAQPFKQGDPFRAYPHLTELADRRLSAMVEDREGRVWIGGGEGLFVTNGTTVERLPYDPMDSTAIPGRGIQWLAWQGDSLLWLATDNGLCAWRVARRSAWRPQVPDMVPYEPALHVHVAPDGMIWVVLRDAFLRVDPGHGTRTRFALPARFPDKGIKAITEHPDRPGQLIITTNTMVAGFDPVAGTFHEYLGPNGEGEYRTVPAVVHAGWIWVGSWGQGVRRFRLDHSKAEHLRIMQMNDVLGGYTTSISIKDDSTLWVASEYGLLEMDADDGTIRSAHAMVDPMLPQQHSVASQVLSLSKGGALAATDNGLFVLPASPYPYRTIEFPDDGVTGTTPLWVMAMAEDPRNASITVGTYDGAGVVKQEADGSWKIVRAPPESDGATVRVNNILYGRDGRLWVASRDGPLVQEPGADGLVPLYPEERIWSAGLFEDTEGRLWIGTSEGVRVWQRGQGTVKRLKHDPNNANSLIGNARIWGIAQDTLGRMWIATHAGLSVYDEAQGRFFNFGKDPTGRSGFTSEGVYSVVRDSRGAMWVSLIHGGVCRVEVDADGSFRSRPIDARTGLDRERCLRMVIDTQDRLWAVNKGVLMIDTRSGTFRRFDRNDGLLSLPDGDAGILVTRDGRLVLHVDNEPRLQIFRVADLLREPAAPSIELLRIRTRTSNTAPDQMAAKGSAIRIKEADLPLQIEFAAIDLSRPFAHQYTYRILGRDSAWHTLGQERSVQFASLEPGEYQVEFRSVRGGRALDNVKRITFIITPPWYRTVLAQIMAILLVILAVFILFRIRLRSVRKEERRKAAFQKQLAEVEMHALRAQMNPHFLFNSLNSIKYYAMTKTPRETADYLGTFAMLIRRILQNSREDLVPLKDELEALRLYIEIESLRLEHKFDHHIRVAEDIDPEQLRLPPMLVQPYVENAIWHGLMNKVERGTLAVDISTDREELRIVIEDDGVGRAKAEEIKNKTAHRERSFGMRITAERMELAAQTLGLGLRSTVEDLVDANGAPCGTRVVLFIPLMHEDIT